jgi:Protein of unknown function (DUF2442)
MRTLLLCKWGLHARAASFLPIDLQLGEITMVNLNISDHDIDRARIDGLKAMDSIRAVAARYHPNRLGIEIDLSTGCLVLVPKNFSGRIAAASHADCDKIEILDSGLGLHWPALDEDWYVLSVLESMTANQSHVV